MSTDAVFAEREVARDLLLERGLVVAAAALERDWRPLLLAWLGIEEPCKGCGGRGRRSYPSTSGWRGGIGGAAMTEDVCDDCWGTGDARRSGVDWRRMRENYERQANDARLADLAKMCGANLLALKPALAELVAALEREGRRRKAVPDHYANVCATLADVLRAGG